MSSNRFCSRRKANFLDVLIFFEPGIHGVMTGIHGLWLGIWGYADFYQSVPIHFRILCPLTTFRTYFVFLACQEHKLEFLLPFDSRENHSRGTMSWAHHLRPKKKISTKKKADNVLSKNHFNPRKPFQSFPFCFLLELLPGFPWICAAAVDKTKPALYTLQGRQSGRALACLLWRRGTRCKTSKVQQKSFPWVVKWRAHHN